MSKSTENVVISGISGRLPECSNIAEFKQHLYEGTDLVTDDNRRWPSGLYGLPSRTGKLKNLPHFDASFFGVPAKQAHQMDPQVRLLLEATFEAIIDAGLNPNDLKGSNTGVYIGCSMAEAFDYWNTEPDVINGYGLLGSCRSMYSNRISFTYNFSGPSMTIDTACSSGMVAFTEAVDAIKTGKCDSAFVGGMNLLLNPNTSLQFNKLGMLNSEGKCKSFDASGNGYVRSEAVVVVYLQKSSEANRVYANVLGVATNTDGSKENGITYPSSKMQMRLIREVYEKTGVDPKEVVYVEAHGTGTKAGDLQEVNAIVDVFCGNERKGLMIGSVKSNMGHSEAASGLCSLIKIILAMENGEIPRNLHYEKPNNNIPGLIDGRLKVISKNQKWNGGIVGMNCFGFGGSNVHVILSSNQKEKPSHLSAEGEMPYIVTVSGRTEESIEYFLKQINNHTYDQEFYSLLNKAHRYNIKGHEYRGFSVAGNKRINDYRKTSDLKDSQIWYVFSGMGSQWPGMGKQLMGFEPFRKSIQQCAEVLKPHDINLIDILTSENENILENVLNSFVAITSIQVALVDILNLIGLIPDGIIGHSVGEIACGYADNTITLEQAVLIAYYRGIALLELDIPKGAMAAVGLSWQKCQDILPANIELACNNGPNIVTVSGLAESINNFISKFSAEGIFVRAVNTSGYAFHSKYIAKAGPKFKEDLNKIIPNPKRRSSKWVSTSITEADRNTTVDLYGSGTYHANNLISPVHFYEATQSIPDGALVLELGPHCLLQAILKRSLGSNVTNVGLMKKNDSSIESFLANIGKIYNFGKNIDVAALYPKIEFPVSRGTPMLSSMIKWDHSVEWAVPDYSETESKSSEIIVEVDLSNDDYKFLAGHRIDGRVLFPAAGYIVLIWKVFAKIKNQAFEQQGVVFENIKFLRATIMPPKGPIKFLINIFKGTGEFEIWGNGEVVSTGKIHTPQNKDDEFFKLNTHKIVLPLTKSDIYKELSLKGFEHIGDFQRIKSADSEGNAGIIEWDNNWITFIDSMMQFYFLHVDTRDLHLPTGIRKIVIDPKKQYTLDLKEIPINVNRNLGVLQAGGIEIRGLKGSFVSKKSRAPKNLRLEKYEFVPFESELPFQKRDVIYVLSQLVLENYPVLSKLQIAAVGNEGEGIILNEMKNAMENEPYIHVDHFIIKPDNIGEMNGKHLVIIRNALKNNNSDLISKARNVIAEGGFLLFQESTQSTINLNLLENYSLELVSKLISENEIYILSRKLQNLTSEEIVIEVEEDNFDWVEPLKNALLLRTKIYVYSHAVDSGLLGLLKCILREPGGENVRSFLIHDNKALPFNLKTYSKIIRKDLAQNVFKNGIWGTYKHLPVELNNEKHLTEHAYINATTRGDLSSLSWIEGNLKFHMGDPNMCRVYYAALNFRDIMLASGKLNPDALPGDLTEQDCLLGMEFSGKDSRGKRVMGIVSAKALATTVLSDPNFIWEVPEIWSLEDAATIPLVYATSYYSLIIRGKMKPGETILIHAGSGGVGQASISISLNMGCKVFTTVSTNEKRNYLKQRFPQLTDENIGYSRDTTFEQWIMDVTNGKGVDLVLNSLAGEQLQASVRCLANNGRFLEIGKVDLSKDTALGMSVFLKNVTFSGILLDTLFTMDCEEKLEVQRLIQKGILNGSVQPLRNTIFTRDEVERAFRFLASGKHIGKVSLKIRDEELNFDLKPTPLKINVLKRTYFNPEKVYILVGGLGGIGLELTNWMISRGAKKLILATRSGVKTGYQSLCLRKWRLKKAHVQVVVDDVTTSEGVKNLLQKSTDLGEIAGIFNLAVVLKEAFMINQTREQFKIASEAKISITKHLDALSRIYAPNLEYFVVFSSIVSGRGNAGHANYGFTNSTTERICEKRSAKKLPALAIQWGPIGDVGILREVKEFLGVSLQSIASCLSTLDTLLQQTNTVVASTALAEKKELVEKKEGNLVNSIAHILGISDVKAINPNHTLADIGIDSMMGTEIKQALQINFDLVFSTQEIRSLTFDMLKRLEDGKFTTSTINSERIKVSNGIKINNETQKENCNGILKNMKITKGNDLTTTKSKNNHINGDNSNKAITFIKMNTQANKPNSNIFMIPPIEGVVDYLYNLAENVDANVYGAEYQLLEYSSIPELADFCQKELKTIKPKGPYKIIGYSLGACVGFELAVLLETGGDKVELILIDGSPDYVIKHTKMFMTKITGASEIAAEQIQIILFYLRQFIDIDSQKTIAEFLPIQTWDERVNLAVKILASKTNESSEKTKRTLKTIYRSFKAAVSYEAQSIFKGDVMLVKANDNSVETGKDYGLNTICTGKINVQTLNDTHRTLVDNPKLASLVNEYFKLN